MKHKHLLKIVAVWLCFNLCIAEPTFPYPEEENVKRNNQFIIEFKRNEKGQTAKQMLFNAKSKIDEDSINVIREIDSRNILVVRFNSELIVETWLKQAKKGIKYFERGKKITALER